YAAQSISGTLQNVELRPTPANPLGIFYRNGSVRIASNVTIQGTLVATGRVTLDGTNIRFCSWDGCDLSGELLVDPPGNWPRLPAIVANDVFAEREIRARIDGAVVVKTTFNGAVAVTQQRPAGKQSRGDS